MAVASGLPDVEKVIIQKEKKSLFSKPETEERTIIDAAKARQWQAKILKKNQDLREEAEQNTKSIKLGENIKWHTLYNSAQRSNTDDDKNALDLSKSTIVKRYGVIVRETKDAIKIETQKATDKQKAAALYVSSLEKWPNEKALFNVYSSETAKEIIKMAFKDGYLKNIFFKDPEHQKYVDEIRAESGGISAPSSPENKNNSKPRPRPC